MICYCCSFVFQEKTELYQRDERLIISSCISCFTSFYMMRWKEYFPGKELVQSPHFQVEVFCYPEPRIVCDYLSWRQSECHNRNQYTTCFWMLVKSGEGENKAKEILKVFLLSSFRSNFFMIVINSLVTLQYFIL